MTEHLNEINNRVEEIRTVAADLPQGDNAKLKIELTKLLNSALQAQQFIDSTEGRAYRETRGSPLPLRKM